VITAVILKNEGRIPMTTISVVLTTVVVIETAVILVAVLRMEKKIMRTLNVHYYKQIERNVSNNKHSDYFRPF